MDDKNEMNQKKPRRKRTTAYVFYAAAPKPYYFSSETLEHDCIWPALLHRTFTGLGAEAIESADRFVREAARMLDRR